MIQKDEIKQRRQEIAEIRHADSVYRDIVARENERENHEKRWFWELLQNAKDSIEKNKTIKIKLEITEDQVSFSHTGNPFELDDILSLIIQGSSKNNKEGKTGRFGTGFITTYLLSRKVRIQGKLINNQGCFNFLLDRDAVNNSDFLDLQRKSNDEFDSSIRDCSYLDEEEYQTKFTYYLEDKGRETANIGLKFFDELIPIVQLFNEQIESVTIINNENTKTYKKNLISSYKENSISEWQTFTVIDGIDKPCFKAYIQKNEEFDSCIITEKQDDKEIITTLNNNYPRLFYTFPLIGTEDIGIPIIVNSECFNPRVERDGIYLNDDNQVNKAILEKSIKESLKTFAELFNIKNISGIYELFNFTTSKNYDWIDHDWLKLIKIDIINSLSSMNIIQFYKSNNEYTCLNNLTIPYTENIANIQDIWELFSYISGKNIPMESEHINWINVSKNISQIMNKNICDFNFILDINKLIIFIENKKTLVELKNSLNDVFRWLNMFYALIIKEKEIFPLDKNIALNQKGNLIKTENISWDKCEDDELLNLSDLINLNFYDNLFSRDIIKTSINSVKEISTQYITEQVLLALNNKSEMEYNNTNYQKCNARFLKWLIIEDKKETIKDLKILFGMGKKENEELICDHFPKSEPLPLAPKSYIKIEFPLYANLIREKDCLNEIYNEFLSEDDYNYLDKNGFIYRKPLIKKSTKATLSILEDILINEKDMDELKNNEGKLKKDFLIELSDFAYLTTTEGHIYDRNTTQKSSLERIIFFLTEAVEKDMFLDKDIQEINISDTEKPILIKLRQCRWIHRAKRLSWICVKTEDSETKYIKETPSSKNISELLKGDDILVRILRGEKQQKFLNKLNVSVSDLIRSTLSSEELKLNWDRAIINMITSNADPELVQEIFNDPNIKNVYEKKKRDRELIKRNQSIGKLIEDLFREYIEKIKDSGISINITREPFGSDFLLSEESSDLVNNDGQCEGFKLNEWLVELKATGREYAAMTQLQAETAKNKKENYALIVVPLDGTEPDINYLKKNAKVVVDIGTRMGDVLQDFNEFEQRKTKLHIGKDGISVKLEDQNIRFLISTNIWNNYGKSIEDLIYLISKKA